MDWLDQLAEVSALTGSGVALGGVFGTGATATAADAWSPPAPLFSGFDFAGTLNKVAGAVSTVANTALNWQMAKDSLEIGRVERAANVDIRKAEIAAGRDIATLQAAAAVERARAQAAPSFFSLGGAGGRYDGILAIAAVAGVVFAYFQLRKK